MVSLSNYEANISAKQEAREKEAWFFKAHGD